MAVMTDDLFDDAPAAPGKNSGTYGLDKNLGRYRFPAPPGLPKPARDNGWRRTTNLIKAFSDQYALQQWLERMTLLGLLANDGLIFDELASLPDEGLTKETLEAFAEKARTAAGADTGARKGTARHNVLEHYVMAGEVIGHRRMQLQFEQMIELMDRSDFEFVPDTAESYVFHPIAGGTIGRRDVRFMCRRTGQVGTIDLKTAEKFWTYQEHAGQQWVYDTAPWVWKGPLTVEGRWVPQDEGTYRGRPGGRCEGKPAALLIHMPSKGGPVQLIELDLVYGAHVASLAEDVIKLRSQGAKAGGICPA